MAPPPLVDLHILPSAQFAPKDRFMPPFWCCACATVDQTANMELPTVQSNAIVPGSSDD